MTAVKVEFCWCTTRTLRFPTVDHSCRYNAMDLARTESQKQGHGLVPET